MSEVLMRREDLAKLLNTSTRSIHRFVANGKVPAPLRLGNQLRWKPEVIQDWIEAGMPAQEVEVG